MKYSLLIGIGILNTVLNGTAATDLTHRIIYYHTMYNRTVPPSKWIKSILQLLNFNPIGWTKPNRKQLSLGALIK